MTTPRHRRAIAASLALVALALGQSACHGESAPPPPPPPEPVGRALLLGDSNISGALGRALEAELVGQGWEVTRVGRGSTGLARPDYFDWHATASAEARAVVPDLAVFMVGGNDGQDLRPLHGGEPDEWTPWADRAAWREAYAARVRALLEALTAHAGEVVMLSPTNRRPEGLRRKARRVAEVQAEAAAEVPGVTYVDMFPLSSDGAGGWLDRGRDAQGREVVYREPDGVHLTAAGGALVAERVLERLRERLTAR